MKSINMKIWEVQAVLADRKTVTRRLVKPQPEGAHTILDCDEDEHTFDLLCGNGGAGGFFADWAETIKAPFWPGDILYVRETFFEHRGHFYYKADGKHETLAQLGITFKWRPSIHMPQEASRIFLRVTDVRVERLRDIDDEGAKAEGANWRNGKNVGFEEKMRRSAIERFAELWASTLKPKDSPRYGWDANPWVWVIEFERVSKEEAL